MYAVVVGDILVFDSLSLMEGFHSLIIAQKIVNLLLRHERKRWPWAFRSSLWNPEEGQRQRGQLWGRPAGAALGPCSGTSSAFYLRLPRTSACFCWAALWWFWWRLRLMVVCENGHASFDATVAQRTAWPLSGRCPPTVSPPALWAPSWPRTRPPRPPSLCVPPLLLSRLCFHSSTLSSSHFVSLTALSSPRCPPASRLHPGAEQLMKSPV